MDRATRVARAAGILEGEAYFAPRAGRRVPVIRCQMTDHDVLLELQNLFGGHIYPGTQQQAHHKKSWIWVAQGALAVSVAGEVEPYLFERRRQKVRVMIELELERSELKAEQDNEFKAKLKNAIAGYNSKEGSLREIASHYGVSISSLQRARHSKLS